MCSNDIDMSHGTKSLDFSLEMFVWITHAYLVIGLYTWSFCFLFLCFQGVDIRWNMPLISTVSQSRILTCHAWTWRPCTTAIIWVMCTQWTSATTIWAAAHYLSFTLFSVARFVEVCYPEFCAFLILALVGGASLALCRDCFISKERASSVLCWSEAGWPQEQQSIWWQRE